MHHTYNMQLEVMLDQMHYTLAILDDDMGMCT
jgi:hypothetical protein